MKLDQNLIARFLAKFSVGEPDECWIWKANLMSTGYGRLKLSNNKKQVPATHVSYTYYKGEFDPSLIICHKCDNPACVNPNHLFTGSHKDNSDDKIKKGRAKSAPQDGVNNGNQKIDIEIARQLIKEGHNNCEIARRLGCTHQNIWLIRHNKSWN